MNEIENTVEQESIEKQPNVIDLNQFLNEFGAGLMDSVSKQHPPVYDGVPNQQLSIRMTIIYKKYHY